MSEHKNHDVNARDEPKQFLEYATDYHAPVLCHTVVEGLITDRKGVYLDATFGGGGHSAAMLDRLDAEGIVIGLDQDEDALDQGRSRLAGEIQKGRLILIKANFGDLIEGVQTVMPEIEELDGILFDLGVSSHQINEGERGFSFKHGGPLDMRMDQAAEVDAELIVNTWAAPDLVHIFRKFGEEPRARAVARAIVKARPIQDTSQLAAVIRGAVFVLHEAKTVTRVFQALRIRVNEELDVLELALQSAAKILKPGGRIAAISYHSLEDRRVKRFLRTGNFAGNLERDLYGNAMVPFKEIMRKPVMASESEQSDNPRARSARLRIAERTDFSL
jgi:16S rRNA (cytosine1402-N4)-methyltransferase